MRETLQPKRTAFFATVAGLAGLAVGYASAGWTRDYYAVVIANRVTEHTPAAGMNWAIQELGSTAETLQVLSAIGLAVALLAGIAAVGLVVGYWRSERALAGAGLSTLLAGGLAWVLTGGLLQATVVGVAVGLPVAVGERGGTRPGRPRPVDPDRREAVGVLGALLGIGVVSTVLGDLLTGEAYEIDAEPLANAESLRERVETAQATSLSIEGVQPPVSEVGDFYTVSKNAAPTIVQEAHWRLTVTGEDAE